DTPDPDVPLIRVIQAISLSTNAYLEQKETGDSLSVVGDTTEGALLVAAEKAGIKREKVEKYLPRVAELPFSSERKAMTTIHKIANGSDPVFPDTPYISITKGAPDQLVHWATHEAAPDGPVDL